MYDYYLAVDIGASSGRHILGHMEGDRMCLEEIYRFPNGLVKKNGRSCWDVEALFGHIIAGMKKCGELGKIPKTMGIDTWGVDFVLLDQEDQMLGDAVGYRDDRTEGMDREVYRLISEEELYTRTGIQKQIFNTVYQLMAVEKQEPELLSKAKTLLMIPDYFHFLLTGIKKQEYTNATTTQLLNPETKTWDLELIEQLGYPAQIFLPVEKPGTEVGMLKREVAEKVGYTCSVVLPATHDTGSAVLAVPTAEEHPLYISSGTWSLMGTELQKADCSLQSREHNLTNEGGYADRFRYLKNIMGLWMIQSVKKELPEEYSFAQLCEMASREQISSVVDCNDPSFLAPESMIAAVREYCQKSSQQVPESAGELACVIYQSLAKCYGETIEELETLTGNRYPCVHVVGGGANAGYLNELTAKKTGRTVYAGPTEATAIGNLAAQMLKDHVWKNLKEARECIFRSFSIETYQPKENGERNR
ncbi:MAG: rhamnulokinase [Fusicatenibacter sp.]|nr:rhamnulokinase [Lachnospiraceae bacterium]MDY2938823.1 rhamnulokinase [Fusicatenibacter sp.]